MYSILRRDFVDKQAWGHSGTAFKEHLLSRHIVCIGVEMKKWKTIADDVTGGQQDCLLITMV